MYLTSNSNQVNRVQNTEKYRCSSLERKMTADSERHIFEAEWYDKVACLLKKFYLYYFPADNTVELFDLKTKKTFLRRSRCEDADAKDFYIGATVTIFSRKMKITNFADQATKDKLSLRIRQNIVLVKSNVIGRLGKILKCMANHNFHVSNIKKAQLSFEDAIQIIKPKDNCEPNFYESICSGPVIAIQLLSKDEESKWLELLAALEKDAVMDGIYIPEDKDKTIEFFFLPDRNGRNKVRNPVHFQHVTCCIIKPHAVQARLVGSIINDIQEANFIISGLQQFSLNSVNAEEFLEVYKGVLPDYAAMVNELQSGPCIAMEIMHNDANCDIVTEFRKFCGPMDPDIAKQLWPNSLRAKYGRTKVQNAVHCSDLPEDGILEVEYFFKILNEF